MEFLVGFVIGAIVSGVVFIVFGKNNKNKIARARQEIIDAYEHVANEIDETSGEVVRRVKDSF